MQKFSESKGWLESRYHSSRPRRLLPGFLMLITVFCLSMCTTQPGKPTPTENPLIRRGREVFAVNCASCHATSPDTVIVGPSLSGIASRAKTRVADLDARQYIERSILRPDAYLVVGFQNIMPSGFGKKLSGEELDAVVIYLMTLE